MLNTDFGIDPQPAPDRVTKTLLATGQAMLFLTNPTSIPVRAEPFILAGLYVGVVGSPVEHHRRRVVVTRIGRRRTKYAAVLTLAGSAFLLLVPTRSTHDPR
ncbi:MAG: hypothetical protein LAQ69_13465 [Acidobacteriia bacterium]|nr:hypothetical protein [Terriglobia bacterium]